MRTSSYFAASAECLKPSNRRDLVGLVCENLCNFRASKVKQRRQRALQAAGNPSASHIFALETHNSRPLKRKKQESSTADITQICDFNNFNPEQRLNPILEDAAGLEGSSEAVSLQGSDVAL